MSAEGVCQAGVCVCLDSEEAGSEESESKLSLAGNNVFGRCAGSSRNLVVAQAWEESRAFTSHKRTG